MQVDQINRSGIVERYIVFKTSGSIKERTQTSIEMGTGCQRNGYWLATNHLSGRGLVQPMKELPAAGLCAGRGCALIRQLANCNQLTRWRVLCIEHARHLVTEVSQQLDNVSATLFLRRIEITASVCHLLRDTSKRCLSGVAAHCN